MSTNHGPRLLWVVCGVLVVYLTGAACAEDVWTNVGTHPHAAKQATEAGKAIRTLCAWHGKLYTGYGDYNANTGPIRITSFDPDTGAFLDEWTSQTEQISVFRPLLKRLFAPAIDPKWIYPWAAGYAVCEPSGKWSDNNVYMEHSFDMATLDGKDLWLVGSYGDEHSVAIRSLNGGATWSKALDLFRKGDNYSRFYYVGVLKGKLFLQSSSDTNSMVFDGESWTKGPPIARVASCPVEFAGKLVLQGEQNLLVFDGVQPAAPALPDCPIAAFCVSGTSLYILCARDSAIRSTADLRSWSTITTAPKNACSLAVLEGKLYVGARNSQLYEFSRTVPDEHLKNNEALGKADQTRPLDSSKPSR